MAASEQSRPMCLRADALEVARALREAGHVVYFAGGCVRDGLLGLEPKDWDVATDAPPQRVRRLFPRTQAVGQAFGVILVRQGRSQIEVATFRADGDYTDGRRPDSVRFATAEEDARRRDFTINGLFLDPIEDRVIDYVGGRDDLATRTLRAIGDPRQRFAEDYLRLLRAVRFAARFGLTIESATREAIVANAAKLPRIAPERIGEELRATLPAPTRVRAAELLDDLGLTPVLLRQLWPTGGVSRTVPRAIAGLPADAPFGLALAAFTFDAMHAFGRDPADLIGPDSAAAIERSMRATLRPSNDELEELRAALDLSPVLRGEPTLAQLKRFMARSYATSAFAMLRAIRSAGLFPDAIDALLARSDPLWATDFSPTPLVTGDDLIAMGFAPGKAFKRVLDAAYDAQLEGRLAEREPALAMARGLLAPTV